MSHERVDDCTSCSGRGYHTETIKEWDPKQGIYIEIEFEYDCTACDGLGYILTSLDDED